MKRMFKLWLVLFSLIIILQLHASVYDVWLVKTDSLGDTLWTKDFYLGSWGSISLDGVEETVDGDYIISGVREAEMYPEPEPYSFKLDKNGHLRWWLNTDFLDTEFLYEWCVRYELPLGTLITTTRQRRIPRWYRKEWRLISSDTAYLYNAGTGWNYGTTPVEGIIRQQIDSIYFSEDSILRLPPRPYSLVYTHAAPHKRKRLQAAFNGGHLEIVDWVSRRDYGYKIRKKYDNGEVAWEKDYPYTFYSIIKTCDDCFVAVGESTGIKKSRRKFQDYLMHQAIMVKLDSEGDTIWTRGLSEKKRRCGRAEDVVNLTDSGGYMVLCNIDGELVLFKTNTDGDVIWERPFESTIMRAQQHGFLIKTSDGGYIIAAIRDL